MKRILTIAFGFFALAFPLLAEHPNEARGFVADRVYSVNDLDTVNAFNGNMIVRIPIGPEYKVNGQLSYRLSLTYNSHIWHFIDTTSASDVNTVYTATPARTDNAGLGWRLSLGKLYETGDPDVVDDGFWVYQSADGADHHFYDSLTSTNNISSLQYTRDSSYIRLTGVDNVTKKVEFPDGTVQTFTQLQRQPVGQWQSGQSHEWFLTSISDLSNNSVAVFYSSSTAYPEIWEIADNARTTKVYFRPSETADYISYLDHVDLPVAGGLSMTYNFGIPLISVLPPAGDTSGRPTITVPVLSIITPTILGEGGQNVVIGNVYSMELNGTPNYDTTTRTSAGALTRLTLPTLGGVGWSYNLIRFAQTVNHRSPGVDRPSGVTERRTYDANGNVLGTWTYERRLSDPQFCDSHICSTNTTSCFSGRPRQMTVFITDRLTADGVQKTTINYFSNYESLSDPDGEACANPGWVSAEHGLPFTRYASSNGRFLSSEVRTGFSLSNLGEWNGRGQVPITNSDVRQRETYLAYDLDADAANDEVQFDKNARLSSTATHFLDDNQCGSTLHDPCYTAVNYLGFDGFGHYKQTSTDGNLPGTGNYRTTLTNYNTAPTPLSPWLLTPFTEQCTVDETLPNSSLPRSAPPFSTCSAVPGALISKTQFDTTGRLTARRTLLQSGGALDSKDLLATYTYDARGNVISEQFYGGDTQVLGVSDPFAPPTNPTYAIAHALTYTNNALTRDIATYANGVTASDVKYDQTTGLATSTHDVADLETLYAYDLLGRIISIQPPLGVTPTTYTYTDAALANSVFTPARVVALGDASASGIGKISKEYKYDPFGRLWREKSLLPDSTWNIVQTDYDFLGRKTTVSVPERLTVDENVFVPAHKTTYGSFDAFGRAQVMQAPDSSVTTFTFTGVRSVKRTVSVQTSATAPETPVDTTEQYDAMGRLVSLKEPNGTVTAYTYDSTDHLTSVTMPGENNVIQHRFFTYGDSTGNDGRGFLHSEQHPELGINGDGMTTYTEYDARGHAHRKRTGSVGGKYDLSFTYDPAERLTGVSDIGGSHPVKAFTFAFGNGTGIPADNRKGKLLTATRFNPLPAPVSGDTAVTETYKYENVAGRPSERDTEVKNGSNTLQSFKELFTYDTLGAITAPGYPTCVSPVTCSIPSLSTATNSHTNGALTNVSGFASLAYNDNGTLGSVTHTNTVIDTIEKDDNGMPRPKSLGYSGWVPQTCSGPSTPSITAQSTQLPPTNQGTTLTATATGCGGALTYQWYRGNSGDTTVQVGTGTSFATGALQATLSFWVRVTDAVTNGTANSATQVITVCSSPVITAQPQSTTIATSNQGVTLSVTATGCGTLSYQWYQGVSGTTSGGVLGTSATYATGALATTTSFWVKVTDSIGPAPVSSNTAVVTVGCTPQITEQPADQAVDFGTQVSVHVTVTGCTGKTYIWYSGQSGDTTNPLGGGFFSTPAISGQFDHGPIWVQISGQSITTVNSTAAMISVRPVSVNAHVTSGTNINITWAAHAHHYLVRRCSNGACGNLPGSPTALLATDTSGAVNTTYVYSIASVDAFGNTSAFSAPDLATTMTFTPVQSGLVISRTHINELLTGVNLVRAAAGQTTPVTWSGILPAGVPVPPLAGQATVGIYAAHITSLRAQMNLALGLLLIPTPAYTDSLTNGTPIKAIHFTELQDRTR